MGKNQAETNTMRDSNELAELNEDRFQSMADVENQLIKDEVRSTAATYHDDKLLHTMLWDQLENNDEFKAALVASFADYLEGPFANGSEGLTPDVRAHIDKVALDRFREEALERIRNQKFI